MDTGLSTAPKAKGGFVDEWHVKFNTFQMEMLVLYRVFAPQYRRKEVYGEIKADIGQILRKRCKQKEPEILEAQACPVYNTHTGKHAAKYKYGNRHF